MKKTYFILAALLSLLLCTCGNPLLGTDEPGGITLEPSELGTTMEDVPSSVTRESIIFIDDNAQLMRFAHDLGTQNYPLDGYYVLRGKDIMKYKKNSLGKEEKDQDGNRIEERIFELESGIGFPGQQFKGTLVGWRKDELQKTTIELSSRFGLFLSDIVGASQGSRARINYITITTKEGTGSVPISVPTTASQASLPGLYCGGLAPYANHAQLENITVKGDINIPVQAAGSNLYAGGLLGVAGGDTSFEDCIAGANVTAVGTGSAAIYAGGFAGHFEGSMSSSASSLPNAVGNAVGVPNVTSFGVSLGSAIDINIQTSGAGNLYAGGVAGRMGNLTASIRTTKVSANVTAEGANSFASYAGGYVGHAQQGSVSNNDYAQASSITITAKGNTVYAGGVTGRNDALLTGNKLRDSSVEATYVTKGYAGGITGYSSQEISECAVVSSSRGISSIPNSAGNQTDSSYAGGIAGYSTGNITKASFSGQSARITAGFDTSSSATTISAGLAYAGGVVGYQSSSNTPSISESFAIAYHGSYEFRGGTYGGGGGVESKTTLNAYSGGVAGCLNGGAMLEKSYAVVSSFAEGQAVAAGGLVGFLDSGTIKDSFAWAHALARGSAANYNAYAGGVAGIANARIESTYAAGMVSLAGNFTATQALAGGIAGIITNSGSVTKSVAAQRFVEGGTSYRVIGGGTSGTIGDNYASQAMIAYLPGSTFRSFGVASGLADNGTDAADVKNFNNLYSSAPLQWSGNIWAPNSAPYPYITSLGPPPPPDQSSWMNY